MGATDLRVQDALSKDRNVGALARYAKPRKEAELGRGRGTAAGARHGRKSGLFGRKAQRLSRRASLAEVFQTGRNLMVRPKLPNLEYDRNNETDRGTVLRTGSSEKM